MAGDAGSDIRQEGGRKEPTVEVSKSLRRCDNRGFITTALQTFDETSCLRSGIRHESWHELANEAIPLQNIHYDQSDVVLLATGSVEGKIVLTRN
jgi:hypothetical protein